MSAQKFYFSGDVIITQDDIERGERCSGRTCPAAIALLRDIPELEDVHVDEDRILFKFGPHQSVRRIVKPPPELRAFIEAVDLGKSPKPITFNITIPR